MPETDFENSIADFLSLGGRLQSTQPLTGEQVLDELTRWYRDSRVIGADLNEDADMLLLQWGATRPLVFSKPTDLRSLGDSAVNFADNKVRYLSFARQVQVSSEEEESDFDDNAVQMDITLGYELADGSERGSNSWISSPDQLDDGKDRYRNVPFVQELLRRPALSIVVTVGLCG